MKALLRSTSLSRSVFSAAGSFGLRKFQGSGRIRTNSGKTRKISGEFGGTQRNSVGFCMALSMSSVGISGKFWGNAGFSGNFGVVSGDLGGQKAFCANSHPEPQKRWYKNRCSLDSKTRTTISKTRPTQRAQ